MPPAPLAIRDKLNSSMPTPPDDATFEDIQYHIYVREKIERGLKDVQEGRVLTQEEAERRLSKWLGE